jgi:N-acetylglucosamine repressor
VPTPTLQKATHGQTRSYNSQLVLRTIYDHDLISRADVARTTGLTRTTVSDLVGELLDLGLAEEVGRGPSSGGKAPILLRFADDSRHLIGVDLGESEFSGAVVNLRGEVRRAARLPLDGRDGDDAVELVHRLIDQLVGSKGQRLVGIGIGTPGIIDSAAGTVRWAVSLNWRDLPLGALVRERHELPVYVANDSQAAALAEYIFGTDRSATNMAVIRVGRGIGAGLILNGELFHGDGFGAGEIGHVTVDPDGDPCRCGRRGCLETVASTRAMVEHAQRAAAAAPRSILAGLIEEAGGPLTMDVLARAVEAGDPAATAIVDEASRQLGRSIASLIGLLDIHRVALIGAATVLGERWLDRIRGEAERGALSLQTRESVIEIGRVDPARAVVLGACAVLLTRELGLIPTR